MLVLSRKVGERIHIGEEIFVEVRRVAGNRVTIAVNAPKSVRILRGELVDAAKEFDVLEEASAGEAEHDTVIMKQSPVEKKEAAVEPPTVESRSVNSPPSIANEY